MQNFCWVMTLWPLLSWNKEPWSETFTYLVVSGTMKSILIIQLTQDLCGFVTIRHLWILCPISQELRDRHLHLRRPFWNILRKYNLLSRTKID